MKKNSAKDNEVVVNNEVEGMSMFELMKVIEHNNKKIAGLSMKIDRLQNINKELKEELKKKIDSIM